MLGAVAYKRYSYTITHRQLRKSWLLNVDPAVRSSKEIDVNFVSKADIADQHKA